MTLTETIDTSTNQSLEASEVPVPGVVLVFRATEPQLQLLPLKAGRLELGRDAMLQARCELDGAMSRRHAEITFDDDGWTIHDCNSRNGTFVDGERITTISSNNVRVIKAGHSLFIALRDLRELDAALITTKEGIVIGPRLRKQWLEIETAATTGRVLHLTGETGSGKELAAHHFHASGAARTGPFIAANCATIPAQLAERLLFGARRGAYTGADANVEGYLQAADGGTLFLDEIGELDLAVQAKLLRAVETQEVVPLGTHNGRKVVFNLVSATHVDLSRSISDGKFREDLYYRIGHPRVNLRPLRERREEIPWLIAAELRDSSLKSHPSLVESALLRDWPGNVRQLLAALRLAIGAARKEGATSVREAHLAALATRAADTCSSSDLARATSLIKQAAKPSRAISPSSIRSVLEVEHGNISSAARSLGIHRTQLCRLLMRFQIDAKSFEHTE